MSTLYNRLEEEFLKTGEKKSFAVKPER